MSSLATQKRYPRSKHGAHQCAYESSSDAVSPALHTHHPTGREALAKGMDQVVSSPPPAPGALLERATDESLLHPGNSTTVSGHTRAARLGQGLASWTAPNTSHHLLTPTARPVSFSLSLPQASTLIYGAALNAAFLALAVVAFVGLRHSAARAPLVSKLFTPRQLVAQVEALEDAEYDGTPREGGVDPVVSRARAMKVLNRDVAATTLPPLPASLAWVLSLFRVTDSQVVVYAGMDGVAFLRFFQARRQHPLHTKPKSRTGNSNAQPSARTPRRRAPSSSASPRLLYRCCCARCTRLEAGLWRCRSPGQRQGPSSPSPRASIPPGDSSCGHPSWSQCPSSSDWRRC